MSTDVKDHLLSANNQPKVRDHDQCHQEIMDEVTKDRKYIKELNANSATS